MNVGGVVAAADAVVVVGHSAYCHPLISNNHHYRCCVVVFVFNSRSCSFVVVIRRTIIVRKHTRLNTHIFCMYHRTHMRRLSTLFEHSFTVYLLGKRTIPTNGMTDRRTDRASERETTNNLVYQQQNA